MHAIRHFTDAVPLLRSRWHLVEHCTLHTAAQTAESHRLARQLVSEWSELNLQKMALTSSPAQIPGGCFRAGSQQTLQLGTPASHPRPTASIQVMESHTVARGPYIVHIQHGRAQPAEADLPPIQWAVSGPCPQSYVHSDSLPPAWLLRLLQWLINQPPGRHLAYEVEVAPFDFPGTADREDRSRKSRNLKSPVINPSALW